MRIRPLGTKVLVELDPLAQVSAGGIHLPQGAVYNHMARPDGRWGTVLAVGPRVGEMVRKSFHCDIRAGERVVLNGWLTDSTKHGTPGGKAPADGQVIVDESDVFLIAEPSEAAE